MKPGVPWSVKGIEPEVRTAAKRAARKAGMTLGEWLNGVILDQNAHIFDSRQVAQPEEYPLSTPQDPVMPPAGAAPADETPNPSARRDDSATRLQDIARQLADLAKKERQTAPARPAPERARPEDDQALSRILERIDDNERQTVEAFTAMNDRLTVLGRQIAAMPQLQAFERPEDVPGYSALESAIRNVVEHIEVSEKRTRDGLKAMQDRLGGLAEQAMAAPRGEEGQRMAPVIASLEARVTELSNRLLRTESAMQASAPEQVRRELQQFAERIDGVKSAAEQIAKQAQSAASGIVRSELREIETRVLATLKETQAAVTPGAASPEFGQLKAEMGLLSRRLDEVKANAATERDLHQLRLAVEHLTTRIVQGPEMKPLADLERRLAELGQRIESVMAGRPDAGSLGSLEQNIAAVSERLGRTEDQLRNIDTMEQAIRQLYSSLEQSRDRASMAAEEAASRTVERLFSAMPQSGRSPELKALEEGLRAVRDSAAMAERRNQDTLAAVHETLSQIVDKIAELESPARGPRLAAQAAPEPYVPEQKRGPRFATPSPQTGYVPEPPIQAGEEPAAPPTPANDIAPQAETPGADARPAGDDFIAAARRAAQAASLRPSTLRAEFAPMMTAAEEERNSLFSRLRWREEQATGLDALRTPVKDPRSSSRRRLLLAGVVLLAAVSAFAFNMLVNKQAPSVPSTAIEGPAVTPEGEAPSSVPERQSLRDLPSDPIQTASFAPAGAGSAALLPPPETGTDALRQAAVSGDAAAQFIVASRYLDGEGVQADPAKAAFWYEQAAASGLAPAQYRLATLFERGKGVQQDPATALSWYERAAEQGNVKSMHNAAVLLLGGTAGPADHARAFSLFQAAAERGLADSQFNLAILYERGLGAKASVPEAIFWYRLAAAGGDLQAEDRAAKLTQKLSAKDAAALDKRVAAWTPLPSDDSANVVAIADAAWREPDMSVSLSGAAVPLSAAPADSGLVAEAQELLIQLGFNVGTADGKLNRRTIEALRQFQAQSGLEVTGEVTPELLNTMRAVAG